MTDENKPEASPTSPAIRPSPPPVPGYPGRPGWTPTQSQPFPLIDADPHFSRVVRFLRPSDLMWAGVFTASAPVIIWHSEWVDTPAGRMKPLRALRGPLVLATICGATAGFFYAYMASSKRFWGWTENMREVQKDWTEMTQRVKEGKSLYGYTDMSDFMQGVSARNSRYSQLKLAVLPWFNFSNHKYHGVDPAMYGEGARAVDQPKETTL
ncbi:hypothetical protein DACRYDRAFT_21086 [Dacryopinax primogenitus]|uniref:NADH-ubiquinone oxidoreductase 21kDa subunit N-terminal domain-containing protein n=1 Tax=Dacryopinax primogenitus (strain DJM 731) TaxID=1858805 RepID=M5G5N7_DACPD|nr:uncharacterized protein DACRYDRAFT_21086 [Dacryopinax primogenitus]EJU03530.1 hypothetical protein DACRYDRAFT_21086 [Dacryopinax primogenitus]